METTNADQGDHFKQFIRDTLYYDMGRPTKPFIKLRGKDADHTYQLEPKTVELFGWLLFYSRIRVDRDPNLKISGYGWYCAGWAISEELRKVLAEAGVERSFFLTWSSDPRIFTHKMRGPAVDVMKTAFDCHFSLPPHSALPDWQKLNEGMKHLSFLVKLRLPDDNMQAS